MTVGHGLGTYSSRWQLPGRPGRHVLLGSHRSMDRLVLHCLQEPCPFLHPRVSSAGQQLFTKMHPCTIKPLLLPKSTHTHTQLHGHNQLRCTIANWINALVNDVAEGPNAGDVGAVVVVHNHLAALAQLDTGLNEAKGLGVGSTTCMGARVVHEERNQEQVLYETSHCLGGPAVPCTEARNDGCTATAAGFNRQACLESEDGQMQLEMRNGQDSALRGQCVGRVNQKHLLGSVYSRQLRTGHPRHTQTNDSTE